MLARELVSIAMAAVVAAMPVSASAACEGLVDGPRGVVASVRDGDTVVLDTGMVVRLIGTQAPKLGLGREGFSAWPLADEARLALERLVLGKPVRVRHGGARTDRHGRTLGQVFLTGQPETWVQQQMIAAGWARVYSFPDNRACVPQLLAAETQARLNKLGIWADPYYLVRRADRPDDFAGRPGYYELVEGRVLKADRAQGRVYLNFGRSWKQDFTAVIDRAALGLFARDGYDAEQLEGALVRIRGWMDEIDGPRVEITHPEQIEVLRAP
ncbi:thermonuclease family protein [Devosia sp.]|uniref:thermonuclease family protein n=1 Tax=Devosia sp. TaxID=1871048 RepID=UPI0025BBDAD7|nr:thermonuclease family protein [Devosia sp.]